MFISRFWLQYSLFVDSTVSVCERGHHHRENGPGEENRETICIAVTYTDSPAGAAAADQNEKENVAIYSNENINNSHPEYFQKSI